MGTKIYDQLLSRLSSLQAEFEISVLSFESKDPTLKEKIESQLSEVSKIAQLLGEDYPSSLKNSKFKTLDSDLKTIAELTNSQNDAREYLLRLNLYIQTLQKEFKHNYPTPPRWILLLKKNWKKGLPYLAAAVVGALVIFKFVQYNRSKSGLIGNYFAGTFKKHLLTRTDPQIRFNWGRSAPVQKSPRDRFSVRWHGFIRIRQDGKHTLGIIADDAARLWIADKLVINSWVRPRPGKLFQTDVDLQKGYYPIKLEYYDATSRAYISLFWKKSTTSKFGLIGRQSLTPSEKFLDPKEILHNTLPSFIEPVVAISSVTQPSESAGKKGNK